MYIVVKERKAGTLGTAGHRLTLAKWGHHGSILIRGASAVCWTPLTGHSRLNDYNLDNRCYFKFSFFIT
jgi:hypothetical protein